MKVYELLSENDSPPCALYRAYGPDSDMSYYGYARRGTDVESVKHSFFQNKNSLQNRGSNELIDANDGNEDKIEFEILQIVDNEPLAMALRNQLRKEKEDSINGPSFFPGTVWHKAKEQYPELTKKKERPKKERKERKEPSRVEYVPPAPPTPEEIEADRVRQANKEREDQTWNERLQQKLQHGLQQRLRGMPAKQAYNQGYFDMQQIDQLIRRMNQDQFEKFKYDIKGSTAGALASRYHLKLQQPKRDQFEGFNLKHAVAAGAIGASLMGNPMKTQMDPTPQIQQKPEPAVVLPAPKPQASPEKQKMAQMISAKYKVDPDDALEIVRLAHKYEKTTFPKAEDILAIIGVESSFDPDAVSGLRRDPAVGLMQVRPKVWGMDAADLQGDIEKQISTGSDILHLYYKKLRHRDAAVAAYNVGMSEFRSGNTAEGYVGKYMQELKQYTGI
jgi:hypothetical protein